MRRARPAEKLCRATRAHLSSAACNGKRASRTIGTTRTSRESNRAAYKTRRRFEVAEHIAATVGNTIADANGDTTCKRSLRNSRFDNKGARGTRGRGARSECD